MKKILLSVTLILITISVYANDTYFIMSGGSLIPTTEEENSIEMRNEIINIELYSDYFTVIVDFNFYNPENTAVLSVGFPFIKNGGSGIGKIYDFSAWTNGKKENIIDSNIEETWKAETGLEKAYVREIEFKAKEYTKTTISYKSTYGRESPSFNVISYLYGTGSSWKSSIESIKVNVKNDTDFWIYSLDMPGIDLNSRIIWKSNNSFEFEVKNIEPQYTDCISINICSPLYDIGPKVLPYSFIYNKRLIDANKIDLLRKDQLRILRNMIYALHGYNFKSEDLRTYFSGFDWYKYDNTFKENMLNQIEKENIEKIWSAEKSR